MCVSLTQCSEYNWSAAKFFTVPHGRNGELVLCVGCKTGKRNGFRIPGHHSNDPVTSNTFNYHSKNVLVRIAKRTQTQNNNKKNGYLFTWPNGNYKAKNIQKKKEWKRSLQRTIDKKTGVWNQRKKSALLSLQPFWFHSFPCLSLIHSLFSFVFLQRRPIFICIPL